MNLGKLINTIKSINNQILPNNFYLEIILGNDSGYENNYLKNGFWAMSQSEELKNPGLTATFIVRIEDVTAKVNSGISDDLDAEAANIYAAAYNKDADFYRFMRTMEIYKETLDKETVLVLSTDGEFLKYLGSAK